MEILVRRFPLASSMIFKNLDDQSLIRSKEACRSMANHLENGKLIPLRIIKIKVRNANQFKESWKQVVDKISVDIAKQLAVAVQKFSRRPRSRERSHFLL